MGARSTASPAPARAKPYYATGQGNVTGLMLDPQGRLLAGTEPNGILYRITAKDKAFALYDSTSARNSRRRHQRPMALSTPSVSAARWRRKSRPRSRQPEQPARHRRQPSRPPSRSPPMPAAISSRPPGPRSRRQPTPAARRSRPPPQPPTTTGVEKSAIYRINPDNTVDTLWSSKEENVYDILPQPNGAALFRHRRKWPHLPPDRRSQTDARRADQ